MIFISYRRGDSEGQAGRLFERLREDFGAERVFMDVTDIDPGKDFRLEIERAIGTCDLLLVVIGKGWLQCETDTGERRLDQSEDWVRLEVAAALRRNIPVIPVLVGGATMPGPRDLPDDLRALAERHAAELSHTHWDRDEAVLVRQLSKIVSRQKYRIPLLVAVAALVLILGGWAAWTFLPSAPRSLPPDEIRVLVADFDGPDPQKFGVTNIILAELRAATSPYKNVRVVPLKRAITAADGSDIALEEGRNHQAAVVIWGWYHYNESNVLLTANFVLRQPPKYMPVGRRWMRTSEEDSRVATLPWKQEAKDLREFTLQKTLSEELQYLTHVTVGMVHYVAEDWKEAIDHFSRALSLTAGEASEVLGRDVIYYKRGFSYSAQKDFGRAIADYTSATVLRPNDANSWIARGVAHLRHNDFDAAVADFDRAIKENDKSALAYQNRGVAYREKGQLRRAIDDYSSAVERTPPDRGDPHLYLQRARAYQTLGDHDRAIADYGKAVTLKLDEAVYYPEGFDYAGTYAERAASYSAKGDHQGAIDSLNEAITIKPSAAAHNDRGIAHKAKGDVARALADYDQAIRLDPNYALAYNNRCIAYVGTGDLDRALADCDETIRLAPDDPFPYNDRGFAYFKKGDFDRAIADYNTAIKLKPDYGLARRNLQEAVQAKATKARGGDPR